MHNYQIEFKAQEERRLDLLAEADQYRQLKEARKALDGQAKPEQAVEATRGTRRFLLAIVQVLSFFFILSGAFPYRVQGRSGTKVGRKTTQPMTRTQSCNCAGPC